MLRILSTRDPCQKFERNLHGSRWRSGSDHVSIPYDRFVKDMRAEVCQLFPPNSLPQVIGGCLAVFEDAAIRKRQRADADRSDRLFQFFEAADQTCDRL